MASHADSRRPAARTIVVVLGMVVIASMLVGEARAALPREAVTCRIAVAKYAARVTKAALRVTTACHKARGRDGALAAIDCSDLTAADSRGTLEAAQRKFTALLTSDGGPCAGLAPADALYGSCPAPCNETVTSIDSFGDLAECLVCLTRSRVEALGRSIHGMPISPLPVDDRRCEDAIGSASSRLFSLVVRDVSRCQATEERAGAEDAAFCASAGFPSATTNDGIYDAKNAIVSACALASFENLDSCAASRFEVANCVGDETSEAARELVGAILALPPASTTTSTTTTTLPPVLGDPLCPNRGELILYSRDTNVACTSNADCALPRHCDQEAGICVSASDLDSGWTGHAHDSDVDDGVVTRSRLLCPGPAPLCGECTIDGVDPEGGSCRCANDTRKSCDQPFVGDADDCGGAICNCYYGVPIPLSSAGTPACLVNRYSEDITGTVNVDDGSSEITARLRTRVYLGITTTEPCPVCGGRCSNSPSTACSFDDDCGSGNTCVLDVAGDGVRSGTCIEGANAGLDCEVAGTNASFPARPGALPGGGGYSLDCMPSVGINISGAGLALGVTQTTGSQSLHANLPCSGGNCFCKTCSSSPTVPCNSDSECSGGSCAVSADFLCSSNSDCENLDLGDCSGIHRCSLATSVQCSTNADCKNYPSGGPCQPATCSALGGSGVPPSPNACDGGACSDTGGGEGVCTSGPDDKTCDGLVRADGRGILSCNNNEDCTANDPLNGTCSLLERRKCFLDPIVATGAADPEFPVGAAAFCVPPTSNSSINQVAGLPGPTRIVNQGQSRAFCAGDPLTVYEPGAGGCP